jgi:CubicO group peptidase (beta-lactamase class C family)
MKNMSKITIFIVLGLLISLNTITVFGNPQTVSYLNINIETVDDFIQNEMQTKHIPGLSAAIVIDDDIVWKNAYGYANIQKNKHVDNDTLFKIGSVSKTITATALMQLYEQEYFNLNDPINNYLSFNVIHPLYPSKDITFHMLLTHSSGINDNWEYMFNFVGDSPIPFQTFLEEYLVPGGMYYDENNNFCTWEPGTSWRYSNIGVALIGYLVEVISGLNFTLYCENNVFNPLDMYESGWYLRDLDESNIAMPYHWNGTGYEPYGHIGWIDVPAGDLRTSPSQLINFLSMYIKNGSYNSQEILNSSTVNMMLSPQLPFNQNLGLIWWKNYIGDRIVWGHGGSDFGARAKMHFDPETKVGVVIFINGEVNTYQILDMLFEFAENIQNNSPPISPKINGPINGKVGLEYKYNFSSDDPDTDKVYLFIEWGDENNTGWIGPYSSGEEKKIGHIWNEKGTYTIQAKAKDNYGAESNWSYLEINIPKNKARIINLKFIDQLFERFLNKVLLLGQVLKLFSN